MASKKTEPNRGLVKTSTNSVQFNVTEITYRVEKISDFTTPKLIALSLLLPPEAGIQREAPPTIGEPKRSLGSPV